MNKFILVLILCMALVFSTAESAQLVDKDFEDQQFTDVFTSDWTWNVNVSVSSNYAHGGTYSLRMNDPGDGWPSVQWMLPRTVQEGDDYYVSYYQLFPTGWDWSAISDTNLKQFRSRGSDGEPVWVYRKDGTTSRILYSFEGTGIGGSPTLIAGAYPSLNTWYRIEFYIKYSATDGEFWFKHNGNTIVSRTGINTMQFYAGPPTFFELFGGNGSGQIAAWYIDDVEIWDSLPTGGDTTAPVVTSASVNGSTATINFSETVVTTGYDTGDFNLDCTSPTLTNVALSSPSGSGSSRTFTIATPIVYGQTCNLDYVGSAGDITDAADPANDMVAIDNIAVTNNTPNPADLTPPVCIINNPTTDTTWPTSSSTITIGGSATDNVGVSSISWTCPTCTPTSGTADCIGCTGLSVTWSQLVALSSGANVFTATATDGTNTHNDLITVTYTPGVGPVEHSVGDVRGVTLRGVKR